MNILGKIKCIIHFAYFYFLKVATRKFEVTRGSLYVPFGQCCSN